MPIPELDRRMAMIQMSTKTTFKPFVPWHDRLRMRYKWYYDWHLNPYSQKIHLGLLGVYSIIICLGIYIGIFGQVPLMSHAAGLTCTSTGTGNWTTAGTWADCGGGTPGAGDNAVIGNGHNVSLTGETTITSGSLTVNGTLTTSNNNITAGAVTIGGTGTIAAGSSTIYASGDFTISAGGTYTAGSSTLNLNGAAQALTTDEESFANVTFSGSGNKTISGTLDVNGNLNVSGTANVKLDTNDPNVYIESDLTIANGAFWTKQDNNSSFLSFDNASVITDSNASSQDLGLVYNNGNFTMGSNLKVTYFENDIGTFTGNTFGYTLNIGGTGALADVLVNYDIFDPGTSTIKYSATNSGGNVNIANVQYSSLQTSGAGETYQLAADQVTGTTTNITGSVTVDSNTTLTTTASNYDMDITGSVTINGTLLGNGSDIHVGAGWDVTNGTFTASTSTVHFTGSGTITAVNDWSSAKVFYNLTIADPSKITTLANSTGITHLLTLGSGTLTSSWKAVTIYNSTADYTPLSIDSGVTITTTSVQFIITANTYIPSSTKYVTLNCQGTDASPNTDTCMLAGAITASYSISITGQHNGDGVIFDTAGYSVTISGTSGGFGVGTTGQNTRYGKFKANNSTIDINCAVDIYAHGTLDNEIDADTSTWNVGGNWTNSDKFTADSSLIYFDKSSASQTLIAGSNPFNNINHSGAGTLQLSTNNLDVDGYLTNSAGTLNTGGLNINIMGDYTNNGTFTTAAGSVTLDGTGAQNIIGNANSFYDLTIAASSARTISFQSGVAQAVTHAVSLNGSAGQLLSLSRYGGSGLDQWSINTSVGATQSLSYLSVSNSNATGATMAAGYTSTGVTNNTNWVFNTGPNVPSAIGPAAFVDGTWQTDNTPTLEFTLSDVDVGEQVKYQIQIDDNSDFSSAEVDYTSSLAAQGAKTYTSSALTDGSYYWRVKAIDSGNNESAWELPGVDGTVDIKVDTTGPNTTSPSATTPTGDSTPTWSWSAATDDGVGTAKYYVKIGTTAGGSDILAETDAGNVLNYTPGALAQGSYYLSVKPEDSLANQGSYTSSGEIVIDLTPPGATTPSATSPTNDTTPTWSWSAAIDTGGSGGIGKYYVKIGTTSGGSEILGETDIGNVLNYTPSAQIQGTYYLSVRAEDSVGNGGSYTASSALVLDTTAPTGTIAIAGGATYTATTSVDLTLSAVDTGGASMGEMAFSNDDISYSSYESYAVAKTFTLATGDGAKQVYVKYKDTAGNESISYSDSIILDTTGPGDFSLFSPANNAWAGQAAVGFAWEAATDAVAGLDKYQIFIDGTLAKDNIASTSTTESISNISSGSHTWYVKALDALGNGKNSATRTFGVDALIPSAVTGLRAANLTNSALNLTNKANVTFSWNEATDLGGSGIQAYLVYIGTTSGGHDILNGEATALKSLTHKLNRDTKYYIYLKSRDGAGNISASSNEITVTLDTSPPSAIGELRVFDVSNRIAANYMTYLNWTASQDGSGSGIQEYQIWENSAKKGSLEFIANGKENIRQYVSEDMKNGKFTYKVFAVDKAGNQGAASSDEIVDIKEKSGIKPKISDIRATPSVVVNPETSKTTALIRWKSDVLSVGTVELEGKIISVTDATELNMGHSVLVSDLKASTTYHYKVLCKDVYGNEVKSNDMTFRTNAVVKKQTALEIIVKSLEEIFSVFRRTSAALLEKAGITQPSHIAADSGIMLYNISDATKSNFGIFVSYTKPGLDIERSEDGKNFSSVSSQGKSYYIDSNLSGNKKYHYRLRGKTQAASMRPDENDDQAPVISDIKILDQATEISEDKAQMAIVWTTDKPATSQVNYGVGSLGGQSPKDDSYNMRHLVILDDLKPGNTYKYKVASTAENKKEASSQDMTFKVEELGKKDTILEIIVKTIQDSLTGLIGWMRK